MTCDQERTQATIFGRATIDGQGARTCSGSTSNLVEPGRGTGTYRILLDTGYDSGSLTLRSGNFQLR